MDNFKIDNFDKNLWFINDARETPQSKASSYSMVELGNPTTKLFTRHFRPIYFEFTVRNQNQLRRLSITEGGNIVCEDI